MEYRPETVDTQVSALSLKQPGETERLFSRARDVGVWRRTSPWTGYN